MKKKLLLMMLGGSIALSALGQDLKTKEVPTAVQEAFKKKYAPTSKVSWEKEKGNYEANWGGKSGEDNSAMFSPAGDFIEIVNVMKISDLPQSVFQYVKSHYKGSKIKEAGRVTDAAGKKMYEAEIKGGDLIFDKSGNFIKKD